MMENPSGPELDLQQELEETTKALREVTLMIEQSQGELSKLTQRNTAISIKKVPLPKRGHKFWHSLRKI